MFSLLAKKVGLLSLVAVSAMGLTACKDSEVLGTIAIVAGVAAIDADDDDRWHRGHGHYNPPGRYYPPAPSCHEERDRNGRIRSTCSRYEAAATLSPALQFEANVEHLASKYALPTESAEKLAKVLGSGDIGKSFGLDAGDIKALGQFAMPSAVGIERISAALAMNRTMASGLVQRLINETREQFADVDSPVWASCMATGQWRTNANAGTCTSTDVMGCAPETGASACAAVR